VGDSVIMGARLAGATTIIAVDLDPRKLEWAKEFGATHTVNPREVDAVAAIKEITGGYGCERLVRGGWSGGHFGDGDHVPRPGGTCVVIGVADQQAMLELPIAKFFDIGGSLRVSWYGDCLPTRDFPLLATWYEQGQLDLDRVVTRVIPLEEHDEAFHAMERGETLRSVIRLEA
jgi:S-(hydroxymethyl)mycothiol dehydrogenase